MFITFIAQRLPSYLHIISTEKYDITFSWMNPHNFFVDSFTYNVTVHVENSGEIIWTKQVTELKSVTPKYTVNLDGYSCKQISISVFLIGKENDKLSIRPPLLLPSCKFSHLFSWYIFMIII